ncbi:hypothetical protein DLR65_01500 [Vibrio tarriae]|nr:hypothetical protein DLR65_01500 [Vibrio tarriae]
MYPSCSDHQAYFSGESGSVANRLSSVSFSWIKSLTQSGSLHFYTCFLKASGMKVHRELDISPLPLL